MQITREELENRYRSTRNEVLAEELGVSVSTLLRLIKKSGIKLKGTGNHYQSSSKIQVV